MRLLLAFLCRAAAGDDRAWARCASENGTCHCPGGVVRFGSSRGGGRWGAAVATRLAGDGVNAGAATCRRGALPADGAKPGARRSCECAGAGPTRAPRPRWLRAAPRCDVPAPRVDAALRALAERHVGPLDAAVAATAAAACGCAVVVYTTLFFGEGYAPVPLRFKTPPTYDVGDDDPPWCLVAVANAASAKALRGDDAGGWRVAAVAAAAAGRKASKVAKVLAHLFFPGADRTLFVDHKLTLAAHPLELLARLLPRGAAPIALGAFEHPCAVERPREAACPGAGGAGDPRAAWLFAEAAAVLAQNRITLQR